MRIGVISDTHGLLRSKAVDALEGVDHILHAGDVGKLKILQRLGEIAPVTAIRGNVDVHGECAALPDKEIIDIGGRYLYMLHNLDALDLNPAVTGVAVVISGHTHKPKIEERKGVLYLNPGSAGPKRFSLPISLGFLEIVDGKVTAELRELL